MPNNIRVTKFQLGFIKAKRWGGERKGEERRGGEERKVVGLNIYTKRSRQKR